MNSSPTVKINAAMTIDGKIATRSGDSKISSRHDLNRVHELRSSVDAIMVGISTVLLDNPILSVRLPKRRGVDPVRIIIDSTARIPLTSRILSSAQNSFTIVAVTNRAPANRIKKIQQCGAMVIVEGSRVVDLRNLLSTVRNIGIQTVLVEGGGELNWSLLRQGLASELIVTIAPIVAGGRTATTLVEGEGYRQIKKAAKMNLTNLTSQGNGEVVLYYRLKSSQRKSKIKYT